MANSKKISVISGVMLIVLLFAFVAMLAVAGLVAPATQTASAEPQSGEAQQYKVLLWIADDPAADPWGYGYIDDYKTIIKNHYASIDNVTVVEKSFADGALTAEEIGDVQLVFIIAAKASANAQDGQYILDASDMIEEFINAGGRVILNGEHPGYAGPANAVFSQLAENIGGNFTVTNIQSSKRKMTFNTTEKAELVKDIVVDDFMPKDYSHIESTNPNAVWVMKDEDGYVFALDQAIGNGYITVITDINWTNIGLDGIECSVESCSDYTVGRNVASRQFLSNLLVDSAANMEEVAEEQSGGIELPDDVYIAGDFNGWATGSDAYKMTKNGNTLTITLKNVPKGSGQRFKFVGKTWDDFDYGADSDLDVQNAEDVEVGVKYPARAKGANIRFTLTEKSDVTIIFYASEKYEISAIVPSPHVHDDIIFTKWESNNSLPTAAGNYYLTCDVVLSGTHYFSNNVNLCLNGYSIRTTGDGAVLGTDYLASPTFNLYDCDDTEHKYCIHDYLAVVDDSLTENYETFKGGYITGGKKGAVDNKATFNMYGGTFIGNTGSSPAVGSEKVFRMYGGAIIGNYATGMGAAGVGASNNNQDASHIYLYGGKIIENTSAGYGGGVMPGHYTYSKYVVGSLEGHEALIVRDNYALKGTYSQDYYHESNVFVWRSSDHPLITMEFQNSAVTPEIGITIDDTVPGRVFASGEDYPDYYSDSWIGYFFSDDLNYEAAINTDSEEYYLDFYLKALPPHEHDFDCSAEGATLTLVCKNTDRRCGLENCTITLTLVAPTLTQQGGEGSEEATISGLNVYSSATNGKTIYVDYYRTGYTGKLDYVPNTQGNYTAKITLGGATASLDYEIAAPVEHLYVADVDMFTVAGGVVNAQTDGVVGTLSGSATLTYGETENDLILTLNDFVYVGSGHVEEVFWAERSSAIWATFFTEKTLKIVFDGQNSITYSDFGMLFLSESNLDVSFEGTGSFHMEDQEYGCAVFFKTADSELDINSGSYDIINHRGYVFDGTLRRMNVNGGTFHAVTADGSVLSTQSFTMTDGVFDVEATKDEMSVAIRGACSIQGGEFSVRAHRAQEYAISAMGLYGSLTVTGGVVNISGEDVGVELYANMNGALNVSGGVVTIQGGVYGCDGYEGAPALISGGEITIIGGTSAVSEDVLLKNTVTGLGWTNVDATEGEEAIYSADEQGQTVNADLKNLQLPKTLHNHVLTYTASGATITATCGNEGCYITEGLTLTLVAPTGDMVYDGNARVATIAEGYNAEAFPNAAIIYYKGDTIVTSCVEAGTYTAKVTFGNATASIDFTIENWTLTDDSDPETPEKQDVTVEIKGAVVDENVQLKVEVKAEIATEEAQGDYTEAVKEKITEKEEVAIVYEVKLLRLTVVGGQETLEEIQPSEIKEGATLSISMKIPEELKGKNFRVLHIHNAGDVSEVPYTRSASGDYISVETDRLSEFAFLVEKADAGNDAVEEAKHGFCIGWVVFIFVMLELLYFALYFILWFPKAAFIVDKCKLGALMSKRCLLGKIGTCVAAAVFIFALVALCVHQCAVTIISFVLALLILAAFLAVFFIEHKDLVKEWIDKLRGKKAEKPVEKSKSEAPAILTAGATEQTNTGYYRITKDEAGKCTFALFYTEEDNLSKEMGVFDSEKEAYSAIEVLRSKGEGVKAENRIHLMGESIPAPKFVLEADEHGVYRYSLIDEDGTVLLQSVQYLNEKRCLQDLKYALICVTTEDVQVLNGTLAADEIETVPLVDETPAEEVATEDVAEEVAVTEIEEETIPEEDFAEDETPEKDPNAGVSLKENIELARATVSHSKINKQYVADYLRLKYAEGVVINRRGNETKTGLPLADTHYAIGEEKNVCFVYVYEVEGTTMLLVKVDDEYGTALAEKHPIVKRSAFPKSKSPWYSVIVDDSFTAEEVEKILDDAYLMNGGKQSADEGISLKETLARAKATVSHLDRTKKGIADLLKCEFDEAVEINCRGNKTKTGLPLADTHYAVKGEEKACFVYVYEVGTVVLLIRLPEDYAAKVTETHPTMKRSAFPKNPDPWYSVILGDDFTDDEVNELLKAAHDSVLD